MIARLRNYSGLPEAISEWTRLGLPQVAEAPRDLYDLVFFFIESRDAREVEEIALATEELGGDAYCCRTATARAMLVFEHGVLQNNSCQIGPDDRLRPIWRALSNYLAPEPPSWRLADRELRLDSTLVMGVLNVTPDSFSDGGLYLDKDKAVKRALDMVGEGADIIDVGGESTRPYSDEVMAEEELRRVVPVIEELRSRLEVPISIDTRHHQVARAALEAGAQIVNDVSGLRDARMAEVVAQHRSGVVVMHMLGDPRTMQEHPSYDDVVGDISLFLDERMKSAEVSGIDPSSMLLDPGIGFGKSLDHNLQVVVRLREFRCLGRGLLIGASRKAFIGKVLGQDVTDRKEGSLAIASIAMMNGASVVRAHDVKETKMVARMVDAVRRAQSIS
ncbi:MAG: dihydropteroate synthase [Methanomassiliicoccales archaeon]|nr:dihydropteroate synthase [Methanomassiliicoccales archaeon]